MADQSHGGILGICHICGFSIGYKGHRIVPEELSEPWRSMCDADGNLYTPIDEPAGLLRHPRYFPWVIPEVFKINLADEEEQRSATASGELLFRRLYLLNDRGRPIKIVGILMDAALEQAANYAKLTEWVNQWCEANRIRWKHKIREDESGEREFQIVPHAYRPHTRVGVMDVMTDGTAGTPGGLAGNTERRHDHHALLMSTGVLSCAPEMPPEFVPTYEGMPTDRVSKPRGIRYCPFYNGDDLRSRFEQLAERTTESTATGSGGGDGEDRARPDARGEAREPSRK